MAINIKIDKINMAAVTILIAGLFVLLFGPIYSTFDQKLILESFKANNVTDWHSLPYQYAAVALDKIGPDIQAKIQIALYFTSIAVLISKMKIKFFSQEFLAMAFFLFSPYVLFTVFTAGKDGLAISIYIIIITLIIMDAMKKKFFFLAIPILIFLMISIREIYILLFIPMLWVYKCKYKYILVAFVLALGIQWGYSGKEVKRSYMTQYLMATDIINIAMRENRELLVEELSGLNYGCKKSNSLDIVRKLKDSNKVNPGGVWNADPVFLSEDGLCLTDSYDVYIKIKSMWSETIKNYPLAYVIERLNGFSQLFYRDEVGLVSLLKMFFWTPLYLFFWAVFLLLSKAKIHEEKGVVYGGILYVMGFLVYGIGYDARYLIVSNLIVGLTFLKFLTRRNEK